jgi:hypothetical protein
MAFDWNVKLGPLPAKYWILGGSVLAVVAIILGVVFGVVLPRVQEPAAPAEEPASPAEEPAAPAEEPAAPAEEPDAFPDELEPVETVTISSLVLNSNGATIADSTHQLNGGTFALSDAPGTVADLALDGSKYAEVLSWYLDPNSPDAVFAKLGLADGTRAFAYIDTSTQFGFVSEDVGTTINPADYDGAWLRTTDNSTAISVSFE